MESTPCTTTGFELPWNLPLDELLRRLHAKPGGLADRDANRRLAEYGPNDALMHRRRQLWRQIIERLANPLIIILLFASGLSAWTGEVTSFVIIVVTILLSVVLDVAQQRAENTIDALRRSVGLRTQVLRDGDRREIAVDQLAPGDVVELKAGDVVPGDLVIFVIRTRGAPRRSTPHPLLTGLTVGVVLIGLIIPLTPLGAAF